MSNAAFQSAVAAFSRGDYVAARRTGEALLRANPGHPVLLQLLGVVACEAGEVTRGAGLLEQAIAAGADTLDNHVNLAKALIALERTDDARRIVDDPRFAATTEMAALRGALLKAQGDVFGALALYEQQTLERPDDFAAWNNLGNARHAAGDFDGALEALGRAHELDPASPLVPTNRARVLMALDRYPEACLALERATQLAPNDPAPLLELGRLLIGIDQADAALRALGTAARLDPANAGIFQAIGLAFTDLGDLTKAEQAYRFAIRTDPSHAPAHVELGSQLERANRLADLDALIAQARATGLAGPELAYLRALALDRQGRTAEAYALVKDVKTNALHAATLQQFCGQLADRLGRSDEAFAAFTAMNQAAADSPAGVMVDRSAYQRDIERLTAATTADWVAAWPPAPLSAAARPAPAFLVGFPRSGTTLLDTFLMGHSATHVLEEVPVLETVALAIGDPLRVGNLTGTQVEAARAHYFAELDRRAPPPPGALVIDKNPLSMIRLPLIHRLFPEARVVLALRHPVDVVLSCFMQNFKVTEAMASFLDLDNAARTYDRIFTLWETYRSLIPAEVEAVRYEDMIADPARAIRPVVDFLDLEWEGELLDHQRTARDRGYIRTPSYAQVVEPVYTRASGRWSRYRDHMQDVLPVLAPWCKRYGYALD